MEDGFTLLEEKVKKAADLGVSALGDAGSKTKFHKMFFPVSEHKAKIIQGDAKAAAKTLVDKLRNEAKVIVILRFCRVQTLCYS